MSKIGNFGTLITFSTSDKKILTFDDFNQQISASWGKHEVIGKKAKSEFLHADLRKITFTIFLSAALGVSPQKTLKKLEKAVETGAVAYLVIGGKKVGTYKWKITDMSETWDRIMSKGELLEAKCNISLEEYL